MNRSIITGRLTKDVELRKTKTGKSSASFTVAVKRPGKDSPSDFIQCQAWDKTAEFLSNYCKKGYLIGVEGRLQVRTYEDQYGKTVYVTEIIADRVDLFAKPQTEQSNYSAPLPEEPPAVDDDFLPF